MPAKGQYKSVKQYESEAVKQNGCLIHPASKVARKVWQRRHGVILPSHLYVCHTCDNCKCILDKHHFIGTHRDNMVDMVKKGRHIGARGKKCHTTPHSEESKQLMSESHKKQWRDKEWRAHQMEVRNSPEFRAELAKPRPKMSIAAKRMWRDSNYIEAVAAGNRKPSSKRKKRKAALARWQRKEYRERVMSIRMSPEGRARASAAAILRNKARRNA